MVATAIQPGTFWKRQDIISETVAGRDKLVISAVQNDKGHRFVDVRKWYYDASQNEWRPSGKGITIPEDLAEMVGDDIHRAAERFDQWG